MSIVSCSPLLHFLLTRALCVRWNDGGRQVKSLDTPERIKCCEKRELQLAELSRESRVPLGNLSRSGKFIGFVWISLDSVQLRRRGDCRRYAKIVH